jgi:transglutaminase-like putative cysteine protease
MAELIQTYAETLRDAGGEEYTAHAYGEARDDGTWEGWLEFEPASGGASRRAGRETTQPDRDALAYWASGLEPIYLDGAFARAS